MDPISAIVAAVLVGATAGLTDTAKTTVADAYKALKNILKRKFGEESDVVKAVSNLERKPNSAGRKETLKEEVVGARVDQDEEALAAALALLEEVKRIPDGNKILQIVTGDQNVVIAGSAAKIEVTQAPPS